MRSVLARVLLMVSMCGAPLVCAAETVFFVVSEAGP